jgi:two-component system, OmpR family, phosphate regulon response regulator PhoB
MTPHRFNGVGPEDWLDPPPNRSRFGQWQPSVARLSPHCNHGPIDTRRMTRVLVVEDDPDISAVVDFNLRKEGFETVVTDSGAKALRLLRELRPELMILDLMLPDIMGLDVCREVRRDSAISATAILMLTAKGQEEDRLIGLESGADDYLVKPFSMRELILRARAVLRRSDEVGTPVGTSVEGAGIVLDETAHRVFVHGKETPLTNTEYKLLLVFLRKPGRVLSRKQLLDQVWNMAGNVVTRTVDTHVKRLREKLGAAGDHIETVRSVGYRFVRPEGAAENLT